MPVEIPDGASSDDVRTAFNVKSISADDPIEMLVTDPDKFFGRTTKVPHTSCRRNTSGRCEHSLFTLCLVMHVPASVGLSRSLEIGHRFWQWNGVFFGALVAISDLITFRRKPCDSSLYNRIRGEGRGVVLV